MTRRLLAWILLVTAPLAVGCQMCAHPFDYSSPVLQDGFLQSSSTNSRAGSILSNRMSIDQMGPLEEVPTPALPSVPTEPDLSDVSKTPGVVILSITDEKLEESATLEESGTVEEVASEPLKRPHSGWTARIPKGDLIR